MTKILVVDDEDDLKILIKQKFRQKIRQNEYEFIFAENGQHALEKLIEHDDVNLVLSICHGVLLIAMSFFAFAVYLSQETTQSIIFLVMVCCFVFSDILNYICSLYVYYWMFEFMSNMLHVLSLALLYMYVYNHHKIVKVKRREEIEPYLVTNSDRITA